jgi:dolichol-phosphate mannosyltransferase
MVPIEEERALPDGGDPPKQQERQMVPGVTSPGDAELDIVIPVYNEGGNILRVLSSFARHIQKTRFRVLICYDRDDDDTLTALASYSAPFPIELVKNRGQKAHGAIMTGFQYSDAPAVLVFPGDDDYNAAQVDAAMAAFRAGAEIVIASRFVPGGCMVGCPWLKGTLVRLSAFALHHLARLPTRDASNGQRLFSRRVLDSIPVESTAGFAYSIELLVKCHRLGWQISEVPFQWYERKHGQSRFQIIRWLPAYLPWFWYAFQTTYLRRGPETVVLDEGADAR